MLAKNFVIGNGSKFKTVQPKRNLYGGFQVCCFCIEKKIFSGVKKNVPTCVVHLESIAVITQL